MTQEIQVAGNWEHGWSYPLIEVDHWGMAMRSFEVARMNMFPVSGIESKVLDEYPTMEALLADKQHLTPVFVDENSDVELADFVHPEKALYVFGRANYSPITRHGEGHLSVRIDCKKLGMLWPHQAMCIVLYDRAKK